MRTEYLPEKLRSVGKERDEWRELAERYSTVIMEIKAENDKLKSDMATAEAMARLVLGQVEQLLKKWQGQ